MAFLQYEMRTHKDLGADCSHVWERRLADQERSQDTEGRMRDIAIVETSDSSLPDANRMSGACMAQLAPCLTTTDTVSDLWECALCGECAGLGVCWQA